MMSLFHSGSEIRIYRASSGNKLDGVQLAIWYCKPLIKNVLISFDGNAENILLSILVYLQIASTYIHNRYPKIKSIFGFWSHRQIMLWVISQEQHYNMML